MGDGLLDPDRTDPGIVIGMRTRSTYPTRYRDVNALLDTLLAGTRRILGSDLIGMYVHGSVATGDFDPDRSDIDFLVVSRDELPAQTVSALQAMHARIAASDLKWVKNYEGSYIPQRAIRRHDPAHSRHPVIRVDGSFGVDEHGSEWIIQRHVIREHGIVLAGPSPETLIDPISADDLRLAVSRLLREWWMPQLDDPFRLYSSEYQAYAILTMCRALYTIEFGAIASKRQAARWAQKALGGTWVGLIESAVKWQRGVELDRLHEALEFIRYTLEHTPRPEGRDAG